MKCESCKTESLIFQEEKDKVTQRRSNYWWCTTCNKRTKPLVEFKPQRTVSGEMDWIELPEGNYDDDDFYD